MKYLQVISLFAVAAIAQNEFPDPDFEPDDLGIKPPIENFTPPVRPLVQELVNINTSTVNLDKALIAFVGPDQVQSTLDVANALQQQLETSNANLAATDAIPSTDENAGSVAEALPYTSSLNYHINHTVVNLVLKKDLAVSLCQGPTVLTAIQNVQAGAQAFIDTVIEKVPDQVRDLVPDIVAPINDALSSASAAFATETTTAAGCTSTGNPPITTTDEPPVYGTTTTPVYPTTTTKSYPTACKKRRRRAEKQL